MEQEEFDLETVYDEQIEPLMRQIIAVCMEHKMPFLANFCYAQKRNGDGDMVTSQCTTIKTWEERFPACIRDPGVVIIRNSQELYREIVANSK